MRNLPPENPNRPMNDGLSYENLQEDFEMDVLAGLQNMRHMAESLLQQINSTEAQLRVAMKLSFINNEREKLKYDKQTGEK